MIRRLPLTVLVFLPLLCYSQHDFDSLYKNSPEFKQTFKNETARINLFDSDDILDITIQSDFKNLIQKKLQGEYQPAILTTEYNDTVLITREIEIKARGNFRRRNCYYPPLMMNFPAKKAKIEQLREFDKMKMVVECKSNGLYQQYLVREYTVYKLYNILTDYSLRVRLIRVHYIDTSGKYKPDTRYAFLIEDIAELAKRTESFEISTAGLGPSALQNDPTDLMAVFQYMIGNTDFSIPGMHNMKLVKSTDPMVQQVIPVAYDFDYSGLVDASYALPSEQLSIKSVRERLFRGPCRTEAEFQNTFEVFRENKEQIYALYQNAELLDPKYVKSSLDYLDAFYQTLNMAGAVKKEFLDNCR